MAIALESIVDDNDLVLSPIVDGNIVLESAQADEDSGILKPRPYQEIGIEWLRNGRRKMLTDQAGLGKTLEGAEAAERPVLVVAPTYLVGQWHDFLKTQYPKDIVVWAKGSRKKKSRALATKKFDWLIVNEQMLRTYVMPKVTTVIVDEAHHFRNRKAQQSKALAAMTKDPNLRVYLLTATPMWRNVDDLWHQLHILQPKLFSSYEEFVELFCVTDYDPWDGIKVLGVKRSMRKELDQLLTVVKLGRTYKDVGRVLPAVINKNIKVDFPKELMDKYNDLKNHYRLLLGEDEALIMLSAAAVMHALRQMTTFPGKVDAVMDALEDVYGDKSGAKDAEGKEPAPCVIFTWYREHAELLYKRITAAGYKDVELIMGGNTPPDERRRKAMRAKIAIATIGSLCEGVNLYHMRTVIFFEEHWPPGSNYQALSRVRRDRNDDGADVEPVVAYYIHVRKTIDEIIHKVTKKREGSIKDLMREVLS